VAAAKATWPGRLVHVEAGDLSELAQALEAGADAVLLDNMSPEEATAAVALVDDWEAANGSRPLMECSGGITVETAAAYAATGVDLLSTSQITQSAPALDIGLDIVPG
jgi:nicotinate-nucleotide pyrophosphorylase (carboxylating)